MPGATNRLLSFSRLRLTIASGVVETASRLRLRLTQTSKLGLPYPLDNRKKLSPHHTPLETTTGTLKFTCNRDFSAQDSLSILTRGGPSKIKSGLTSTSKAAKLQLLIRLLRGQKTAYDSLSLENLGGQLVCLWLLA